MDTSILEELGLTKSEIRVYLALLELGASRTGSIVREARVSRSKIYELLDKLSEKGLTSYVIRENTKYFEAANPHNLMEYTRQQQKELTAQEMKLQTLIPKLQERQNDQREQQTVTLYEGYKGIRTVFNDILDTLHRGQEYYSFAVEPNFYTKTFSAFIMNYHRRRQEKGIKIKLMAYKALKKRILRDLGPYKNISFRFTQEQSPVSTIIYGEKVFVFTWKPTPTAILITSTTISQQYKRHFVDIWKRSSN